MLLVYFCTLVMYATNLGRQMFSLVTADGERKWIWGRSGRPDRPLLNGPLTGKNMRRKKIHVRKA